MLAVGVIAVSITSMIGLLGAITANITQIRHQQKSANCVALMETILRTKRFDEVFRWVSNPSQPYVVYFWDEYQNPDDPDNSSLLRCRRKTRARCRQCLRRATRSKTRRATFTGRTFRSTRTVLKANACASATTPNTAAARLGGDASNYALSYLPLTIEVFAEPRQDITKGSGDDRINEERRVFQGLIMKMR